VNRRTDEVTHAGTLAQPDKPRTYRFDRLWLECIKREIISESLDVL